MTAPRKWWDNHPRPVRAVLELAYIRREMTPEIHDLMLDELHPAYAEAIRQIAADLRWAEDFWADPALEVLARYGVRPIGDPVELCSRYAEEKERSALLDAQLVASLRAQRPIRIAS